MAVFLMSFSVSFKHYTKPMRFILYIGLLFAAFLGLGFTGIVRQEPDIPADVIRKFKRDAARLSLRLQMQDENLRYLPIQIASSSTEKIFKGLCQIYTQTDQGKRLERCNIHTFPDPSIDHMVVIYNKYADWASPLQKGLMQTNSNKFNDLVAKHKLVLEKHVLWTDKQNAITLRAKEPLNMSALANEFSQIEGVQDIDLGIPKALGNDIQVRLNKDALDFEYILRFGSWTNGKGESHIWYFQMSDGGKIKSNGDTGAQLPTWLKCQWEPHFSSSFRN
jgi:hypothetical protein